MTGDLPRVNPRIVPKPWGREEWLYVGDRVVMKRLVVRAGSRFSLQYHERKEEAWVFERGRARVRLGDTEGIVGPGDVIAVRPGTVHRVEALENVTFLEVSTPELEDVVRLEDDFGRAGTGGTPPAGGDEA